MPSDSDTVSLEVDRQAYERFEEERKRTKSDHAPAMSESLFLSALLDTDEAVRRGYYGELDYPEAGER